MRVDIGEMEECMKQYLDHRDFNRQEKARIEKEQDAYIRELVFTYLDQITDFVDPKGEFNTQTLAKKCFEFIKGEFYHIKYIYFGMGSYNTQDLDKWPIYKLGWIGVHDGEWMIKMTEAGHVIARDYYGIAGYEEKTWYTPVKVPTTA